MTGDDREDYIERCYEATSPDIIGNEVQAGVSALTKGGATNDLAAVAAFCLFFNQFPNSL